jgi:hypothetical protein
MTNEEFLSECRKRNVQPFKPNVGTIQKPMFTNGFVFNTVAGGSITFQLPLSGNVSELLGIVIMNGQNDDIGSLKVNNDILLQDTSLAAFNPSLNIYKETQYYRLPRKLMGTDNLTLTVQSSNVHQIFPVFYLLPR